MYLPRNGREDLRITLANTPDEASVEVSFDGEATWHDTTNVAGAREVPIAGPAFAGDLNGAVRLLVPTRPKVRFTDSGETVIRSAPEKIWFN